MSIIICNLKNELMVHPWDFRVDRQSPIGNPYFMASEMERGEVCRNYKLAFPDIARKAEAYIQEMLDAFEEYGVLRLFCWCAPKQCHAETVRGYLNEKIRTETVRGYLNEKIRTDSKS